LKSGKIEVAYTVIYVWRPGVKFNSEHAVYLQIFLYGLWAANGCRTPFEFNKELPLKVTLHAATINTRCLTAIKEIYHGYHDE